MQRSLWTILTLLAVAASSASAGRITGVTVFGPNQGTGPGLGFVQVPIISTPNIDNDNQPGGPGGDNNVTVPLKRFDNVGYIDIEFLVDPTNGITEYKVSETVDNDTGVDWAHYRMELGFGVDAAFERSTAADGLSFDAPLYDPPPTSTAFPSVSLSPDVLVFSGGVHGLPSEFYQVRIDVPNLSGGKFTLRQIPIVPEPTTIVLFGLGAVGFIALHLRPRM